MLNSFASPSEIANLKRENENLKKENALLKEQIRTLTEERDRFERKYKRLKRDQ